MESTKPVLWMGDFNRHHPHWDNLEDTRLFTKTAMDNAELLISAVAGLGLDLVLPPGIPTHLHNVMKKWTRLDQVFMSDEHTDSVITCKALSNTPGINTNHGPSFLGNHHLLGHVTTYQQVEASILFYTIHRPLLHTHNRQSTVLRVLNGR